MIVHVQNPHENRKTEDIAREMVGKRTFIGWPFLQEGMVAAVSDSLFKYEKMAVVPGSKPKVVSNPHAPQGLGYWKMKSERIATVYSKKCGVMTGDVDVLVHVRPLKGLKRLESGAFVKDYEGPDKETEQAVQMVISEVASEDPRFLEKDAPPLSEEFPEGSKIFFLGEHAYGVAAQVSATNDHTLSVVLAFFPSDKAENDKFKAIVDARSSHSYVPSFKASNILGITGRALSKITSSFMVLTSDHQKTNIGLSLKFEGKSQKVVGYSRKDGRNWEYSDKAVDLIREYKSKFPEVFAVLDRGGDEMARASDVFHGGNADAQVKEVKSWLKSKGVRDFEPVSLFSDQLSKDTVAEIEKLADSLNANKSSSAIKKAMVKGIPRHAVLKPSHAIYRLQNQHFALGDRVTMVQDSGGVPLSVKGVVVGLNSKSMDVAWDVPFMSGVTLGDRCSQYRGSTVEFNSCLNLSNPQFIASTNPKSAPPPRPNVPFKPRFGPQPAIQPPPGQPAVAGFRPAPQPQNHISQPMHIMSNPHRGRGGYVNGRGGPPPHARHAPPANPPSNNKDGAPPASRAPLRDGVPPAARDGVPPVSRGGVPHPRGHHNPHAHIHPRGFRGRGGFVPHSERGRGVRGRGRGGFGVTVQPLPSS
ncbi:hypothetical protein BV22DRAFT_1009198 [Leucogyrophana mollusca]|uniref:Uncharacterized protein n=1 Tax=Leucogyrophana mollusca TaxID=85980 RepID=A0ACB8BND6_9AGAM|nr:hypothetical protein BV22DRAFT_1009198 [Leucogyrophana mollusca]